MCPQCPVCNVGDKTTIDDPEIVLEKTDTLSTHAFSSLLHYVVALELGAGPLELGLSTPTDWWHAYIQCVDLGEPYTRSETVVFKIRKAKKGHKE